MKKIFKIIGIVLLSVFFVSTIGFFVLLKTFEVNRFKPQIIVAAKNYLGRNVDFGDIALKISLRYGVQLYLSDLVIGEHPAFGSGNFLTAEEINLSVSVRDLILKRQIRVLGIEARSPRVTIIRYKDGRINAQSFGMAAVGEQGLGESTQSMPQGKPVPVALPAVFISRINIDKAQVKYIDYYFSPEVSLDFQQIRVSATDISLTNPFPISASMAFLSNSPNITLEGQGEINISRPSFLLKDAKVTADFSSLSIETLRHSLPQLQGAPLFEIASGQLTSTIKMFEVGPQGLIALDGLGSLTRGLLRFKELAVPFESIAAKFAFSKSAISLNAMSFSLGKGRIELSGDIKDYLIEQNYSVKAKADSIDLAECIDQSTYPIKAQGLFSGEFELEGQGFAPEIFLSKLSGNGRLEINEGRLTDINILKMVLDRLSFVPNLGAALEASLPERFKEKLRQKDTIITAFKATMGTSNGAILIQPINMEADGFLFQGNGTVGFNQSYAFDGSFIIPQDLASRIIGVVPEMEFLIDETKQIRFPLKVYGKGVAVSFTPDIKQVGITAIKNKGRQELEKVLDKIFDKDKESTSQDDSRQSSVAAEPTKDTASGNAEAEKKSGKQQLIESVIDTIFKQ